MLEVDWLSWIVWIKTENLAGGLPEHTHRQKFVVTRETQRLDPGMDIAVIGPGPVFSTFIEFAVAIGELINFPGAQMNAVGTRQASSKNF